MPFKITLHTTHSEILLEGRVRVKVIMVSSHLISQMIRSMPGLALRRCWGRARPSYPANQRSLALKDTETQHPRI